MRRWFAPLLVIGLALAASCDDEPSGTTVDAGVDAPARLDAAPAPALTGCIEAPGALPRPPVGRLPCELVPPGLTL
jgi:hypothetical protein